MRNFGRKKSLPFFPRRKFTIHVEERHFFDNGLLTHRHSTQDNIVREHHCPPVQTPSRDILRRDKRTDGSRVVIRRGKNLIVSLKNCNPISSGIGHSGTQRNGCFNVYSKGVSKVGHSFKANQFQSFIHISSIQLSVTWQLRFQFHYAHPCEQKWRFESQALLKSGIGGSRLKSNLFGVG
ncbi:hypothetical protein CEXT_307321 [Caerostris extrusa]|uniref:Uncharacterized protein n=1 Tax=Caerostris extrusa TaxID=172846 RepID=A0AAV4UVZ7_CAEEX|nr:hypothetical protein CEXT_307321 [Caerostris extrusa]